MSKNKCNKYRKVDNPYEVWVNTQAGWEWRVLKKWQNPENEAKNEFARWFCAVKSPMTHGSWEYGDTYVKDIKSVAYRVEDEVQDVEVTCCNVEITQEIKDNGLCPKCLEHL